MLGVSFTSLLGDCLGKDGSGEVWEPMFNGPEIFTTLQPLNSKLCRKRVVLREVRCTTCSRLCLCLLSFLLSDSIPKVMQSHRFLLRFGKAHGLRGGGYPHDASCLTDAQTLTGFLISPGCSSSRALAGCMAHPSAAEEHRIWQRPARDHVRTKVWH